MRVTNMDGVYRALVRDEIVTSIPSERLAILDELFKDYCLRCGEQLYYASNVGTCLFCKEPEKNED